MRKFLSYVLIIGFSIAIAGCGGRKAVEGDVQVESVDGTAGASSTGLDGSGGTVTSGLDDGAGGLADGDLLGKRVVYFEYDSSVLTLEGESIVQAHAEYLVSAPGTQVILEGHADERGTREYNLALGEDRAKSVSDLMQAHGVSASRIQVVSYGEERPVSLDYDEAAFALNRRVEILYQ